MSILFQGILKKDVFFLTKRTDIHSN